MASFTENVINYIESKLSEHTDKRTPYLVVVEVVG